MRCYRGQSYHMMDMCRPSRANTQVYLGQVCIPVQTWTQASEPRTQRAAADQGKEFHSFLVMHCTASSS